MPVPPISLADQVVLVTGGASGIGRAAAKIFAELGAKVAIADLDGPELQPACAEAGAALAVAGDVSSVEAVDALVAEVAGKLGSIDAVFNCAGIADSLLPTLEQDLGRWQRILDINLRGTFLVCRAAGRLMLEKGRGSIINVSSINGIGGFPRRTAYNASKAGVAAITRSLACEWGGSGVRVNAVAPGYIETPMVKALVQGAKIDIKRIEGRTPMARLGQSEEIALAAAFLMSDWASYITGAILPVDGGWTAFGGAGDVATA